ncbi:hypothetical protein JCM16138_15920 [Thermococcus atlanticus]
MLPAVVAYRERGNIAKLAVYGIAGIAVAYFGYKIYKQVKRFGGSLEAVISGVEESISGVKESIDEIRQYGFFRPLTPHDTLGILEKRASKNPSKPYYVEESIYKAMLEEARKEGRSLPKNVKPTVSVPTNKDYKEAMEKSGRQYFDSKFGLDIGEYRTALEKTKREHEVGLKGLKEGSKEWNRIVKTEAERWSAIARKYVKMPGSTANPMPKKVLLEKLRRIGGSAAARGMLVKPKPVFKYQPLPIRRSRFSV